MDAEGARELARRIGANGAAPRTAPVDAPAGSLPLYRWFGGGDDVAARAAESAEPENRPPLRRLRLRGR